MIEQHGISAALADLEKGICALRTQSSETPSETGLTERLDYLVDLDQTIIAKQQATRLTTDDDPNKHMCLQ